MTTAPVARERLRAAQTVWRLRPEHPTLRDHAYLVYVTLLVIGIVAAPIVRAVVLTLAQPESLALLGAPGASTVVGLCGAAAWVGALAVGRRRGPVVPPPFIAQTLGDSEIPPLIAWGVRALRALAVAVALLTGLAALVGSGFLATDSGALFVVGAALFAVPAAVLWLAGQALPGRAVTAVGALLVVWAIIGLTTGAALTPWGMLAALWPGAGPAPVTPFVALAPIALVAAVCAPPLVSRLDAQVVRTHAQRWEAMTLLARTGDLAGAAGRLRPPPAVGRRWRMPLTRPLWWATLQRDAVAAARNPAPLLTALAALAAAGALWGRMPALPAGLAWVAGLPAALLCFAGLGPVCDGIREAVDSAGRPALFRPPPGRLLGLHLMFPALAAVLVPGAAAVWASGTVGAAIVAAAMGILVLAVRVMDAAKPPLPIGLLMPVPTPAGDASGMFVVLWQADAVLITAAAGSWLAPALASGGTLWLLASFVVVVAIAAARVHRASR